MKKHVFDFRKFEKAQILPIVAIGMFAIIGLAAILLDGGVLMANRRSAQAAADAGALAGARLSCKEASATAIIDEARRYAVDLNNADPATTADYDPETKLVTVVAQMEQNSWFAKIFDQDKLTTRASASAGCYYPSAASYVMPIAFYYRNPPVDADDNDCSADGSCALVNWNFDTLMQALRTTPASNQPLDDIYIVANNVKICEKPVVGPIVCSEMSNSGGNRQWLVLKDFGSSGDIKKIIENGLNEPLYTPGWVTGDPGEITAVYGVNYSALKPIPNYEDVNARIVNMPLYDVVCPIDSTCDESIHDYTGSGNSPAYRIVGFAPFVLTCSTMNDKCEFGNCIPAKDSPTGKDICPGYLATNPEKNGSAIEGYFVDGLPADMSTWGTGGVDAGIYIISLSD
jgi:Flp pilus assembly protein TadG